MATPDPVYPDPARERGWSRGGIIGAIIAVAFVAAIIAYGSNRNTTNTATGPNTTTSAPSTTGQGGGGLPAGSPGGVGR